MTLDQAKWIYVAVLALNVGFVGKCLMQLEADIQMVLAQGRARDAYASVVPGLLTILLAVPFPLVGAHVFEVGNPQKAALPGLIVIIWVVLLFSGVKAKLGAT